MPGKRSSARRSSRAKKTGKKRSTRAAQARQSRKTASNSFLISDVSARQVLDSRGNPTVESDVFTKSGQFGRGTVPSGASTGVHEALELRDTGSKAYGGMGVQTAVSNITNTIRPKVLGIDCRQQDKIDSLMIELDGTPNKARLGANAILAVSMASARAASASEKKQLFEYLAQKSKYRLPVPMMNVINGGKHAGNNLSVQEFLIEPVGAGAFPDALRIGVEVYHALKSVLKNRYGPSAINVGDEGGYAPPLDTTPSALDAILEATKKAGYDEGVIRLGLDSASSNFFNAEEGTYQIDGKKKSAGELLDFYTDLVSTYPILTLEDPFAEDSFEDSARITSKLGSRVKIIGDDLYVTNPSRIQRGIEMKATNAILIKLNQIGSVSETLRAIEVSKKAGFAIAVSHRSGETEDTFISHLATAVESEFIKTGAPARGERTAKYNELLRIAEILAERAGFAGSDLLASA